MCGNRSVAALKARQPEGRPLRLFGLVVHKVLPFKRAVRISGPIGQRHIVVNRGDMLGRHANLDHLNIIRGKEHAVPDFRGLDHT